MTSNHSSNSTTDAAVADVSFTVAVVRVIVVVFETVFIVVSVPLASLLICWYLTLWIGSIADKRFPAFLHVHLCLAEYGLLIAYLATANGLYSTLAFGLLCAAFGLPLGIFMIARRRRWLAVFREIISFWWSEEFSKIMAELTDLLKIDRSTFALPDNRIESNWFLFHVVRVIVSLLAILILKPIFLVFFRVFFQGLIPFLENVHYIIFIFVRVVGFQMRMFTVDNEIIRYVERWRDSSVVDSPGDILFWTNLSLWLHLFCFTIPVFSIVLINHLAAFGLVAAGTAATYSQIHFNLSVALIVITAISLVLNGFAFLGFRSGGNKWSEYNRFNFRFPLDVRRVPTRARAPVVPASVTTGDSVVDGAMTSNESNRAMNGGGETEMVHLLEETRESSGTRASDTSSEPQLGSAPSIPAKRLNDSFSSGGVEMGRNTAADEAHLDNEEPRSSQPPSEEGTACVICTTNQYKKQALGCGHVLCSLCIEKTKRETNRCPFCNKRISFIMDLYL